MTRWRTVWANPWVRWPVNILSVLLMIPLLAWLAFYALSQDEPLGPEIDALMAIDRLADDPGNAYFGLVGITAPEQADAVRIGSLAVMIALERQDPRGSDIAPRLQLPGGDLRPVAPIANPCPDGRAACVREMRAVAQETEGWLKDNEAVWNRFLEIAQLPRYADVELDTVRDVERLKTLAIAARRIAVVVWSAGQRAEAMMLVDRNLSMCRLVLGGTVALATKRAAARCVADAWELAAALLLDQPRAVQKELQRKDSALGNAMARLTPLLSPEELAFAPIVRTELRAQLPKLADQSDTAHLTANVNPWIDAALRPFYRRNATINQFYALTMQQASLDRMSNADLVALRRPVSAVDAWERLRTLNPIGERVLDFAPTDGLVPYMLEVRALESQRRLFLVTLHCVRGGFLLKDPAACVANAPRELSNPFDGSAPQWDESQRRLVAPIPVGEYTPKWVPTVSFPG